MKESLCGKVFSMAHSSNHETIAIQKVSTSRAVGSEIGRQIRARGPGGASKCTAAIRREDKRAITRQSAIRRRYEGARACKQRSKGTYDAMA